MQWAIVVEPVVWVLKLPGHEMHIEENSDGWYVPIGHGSHPLGICGCSPALQIAKHKRCVAQQVCLRYQVIDPGHAYIHIVRSLILLNKGYCINFNDNRSFYYIRIFFTEYKHCPNTMTQHSKS